MRPNLEIHLEGREEPLVLKEEPLKRRVRKSELEDSFFEESPPQYKGPGPHGSIFFELHNAGRTTANNVRGWLYFESARLKPINPNDLEFRTYHTFIDPPAAKHKNFGVYFDDTPADGLYRVTFREDNKLPGTYRSFEVPVVFVSLGLTHVTYSFVCDEGAKEEGFIELKVPSVEEHARRIGMGVSGMSDEQKTKLKESVWEAIREEWNGEWIESTKIYERIVGEGAEVPDYAMIEVLNLLQDDRIRVVTHERRSEEEIKRDGGETIIQADA